MATAMAPGADLGSIEALKRVKATETDWELKLRAARGQADEAVQRLRSDADDAVKAAQATADADRARTVEAARASADREAEGILEDGRKAADAAARGEGKRVVDKKDAILAAVLAGFSKD